MSQNDVLKVLLENEKLLKQTMTREGTPLSGITIPYTQLTFSGLTTGAVFRATSATAASFGQVDLADTDAVTGTLPAARGGTGVSNAGTITNASNTTITGGGTLALGGFTLTAPATGTAALRGTTNTFSLAQTFSTTIEADSGINVGTGTGASTGQICTSGNVGFGDAVQANVRLYAKGSDATSSNYGLLVVDSGGLAGIVVRNDGLTQVAASGGTLGFYGSGASGKPTVTGSRGGNAALASLLTALANMNLLTNSSTA